MDNCVFEIFQKLYKLFAFLQCPTQTSTPVPLLIRINYQLWMLAHFKCSPK